AWKTLGKATASAQRGDLFLVRGTFTGQYIRPAASGTAANRIVFRAMPNELPRIEQAQYGTALWLPGVSYVVVEGFELTGNSEPASLGDNDWMRACKVHDNTGYIRVIDAQNARVKGNGGPDISTLVDVMRQTPENHKFRHTVSWTNNNNRDSA